MKSTIPHYWLMKSEPSVYGIQHLQAEGSTAWEGVRNYQARNFMRDQMKLGDIALFYHSNATPSGVAGIMTISQESHPDPSSWNPKSIYYDPLSSPDKPRWFMVRTQFQSIFPHFVSLSELKQHKELKGLMVLEKGSRLSIQPLSQEHFHFICKLGKIQ